MTRAIAQVERELDAALQSLDGWAENVFLEEQHRIAELKTAWRQQANHIRELACIAHQAFGLVRVFGDRTEPAG